MSCNVFLIQLYIQRQKLLKGEKEKRMWESIINEDYMTDE